MILFLPNDVLSYLYKMGRGFRFSVFLLIMSLPWSAYSQTSSSAQSKIKATQVTITEEIWGQYKGHEIQRFTFKNAKGMQVSVTNWGAYVTSILVPNKNAKFEDVILGYDTAKEYVDDCCFNGATVGRFANRIANGRFDIDEETIQLSVKSTGGNKGNHLHGGEKGFNKKLWRAQQVGNQVEMFYLSQDGEEGYPGNLSAKVVFSLDNNNGFKISYSATSDKITPVNLISHIYFNLTGNQKRDVEQHQLRIAANSIVEVKEGLLPTGQLVSVADTPFDLSSARTLYQSLTTANAQLKLAGGVDKTYGGFDHTWVFSRYDGKLRHQAQLHDPDSGRTLDVLTTQPGLHVYTGNFMNGSAKGKQGRLMKFRHGVALETQHFADSVNHPNFPSTLLHPGQTYEESTLYQFGVKE